MNRENLKPMRKRNEPQRPGKQLELFEQEVVSYRPIDSGGGPSGVIGEVGFHSQLTQMKTLTRGLLEFGTLFFFVAFTAGWLICGMVALDRTKAA